MSAQDAQIVVSSVLFSGQSVELGYMHLPTGVRDIAGSPVAMLSSLVIEMDSPAYAEQIKELAGMVQDLVVDILEDWDTATSVLVEDEDEEQDKGMGE